MIDYSLVQDLIIPEGAVQKIENQSGQLIWEMNYNQIMLGVEKITSNTFAGETTYENEKFILLDIYPKTNGTVTVLYGKEKRVITDTSGAEEPNSQQVAFGTFHGESDDTPSSGVLTIKGDCVAFACGAYTADGTKITQSYCNCIIDVYDWYNVEYIPQYAFYECSKLALSSLPNAIVSIGDYAFYNCSDISINEIPYGVKTIGENAFYMPTNVLGDAPYSKMSTITLPETIESIGKTAFAWNETYKGDGLLSVVSQITILATTPPILGENVFGNGMVIPQIIVPKGYAEIYKSAEGWSAYATNIEELS